MTVTTDLGTPEPCKVRARRGSPWRFQWTFTFDDDRDFTGLTDIICVLKRLPGGDSVRPTITLTPDMTQAASLILAATATAEETVAVPASTYLWEVELVGVGQWFDDYAPLGGEWHVKERQAS